VDVVFVEPLFPANQREFVRALHAVGARVIGIGERPKSALTDDLRHQLTHYEQIGNVTNAGELEATVRKLMSAPGVNIQRLEAVVEAHVMAAAKVREACGIPGISVKTTFLCRDKPEMKEALRKAGVSCAQSIGSSDPKEIKDFAERVGFPLIVKPRDAAGASGTHRCDNLGQLNDALVACHVDKGRSVAIEEYIEGHEGFYDTITINGKVEHDFVSHYYPNVLEAMRTRWISPQFIATNRADMSSYKELREMGQKVVEALEITTSATHMEWFYGPKGLKFSEIGCRPPGVRAWDLYAAGNEFDIYREWAMAIVHGRTSQRLSRRFAAGIIALRPDRDGRISHYDNKEAIEQKFGGLIIDGHFPPPGTPTQGVEAGYMANAWLRLKHPDYDTLRSMLNLVGENLKVRAQA
jgi:carbamoylphosphate synthase large subunit